MTLGEMQGHAVCLLVCLLFESVFTELMSSV